MTPYIAGSVTPARSADIAAGNAICFISLSFVLKATPKVAPACAVLLHSIAGMSIISNPGSARAIRHAGTNAQCIPVIMINGMNPAKSSIASHGANPYTALITNWSPFPTIRPRGASRQSVMGAVMITISSGFKKFFDQSGVILSIRISTYFRRIVESMAGMMEEE